MTRGRLFFCLCPCHSTRKISYFLVVGSGLVYTNTWIFIIMAVKLFGNFLFNVMIINGESAVISIVTSQQAPALNLPSDCGLSVYSLHRHVCRCECESVCICPGFTLPLARTQLGLLPALLWSAIDKRWRTNEYNDMHWAWTSSYFGNGLSDYFWETQQRYAALHTDWTLWVMAWQLHNSLVNFSLVVTKYDTIIVLF